MLRSYFYKLFHSPLFYLGFLATLALCLYSISDNVGSNVFFELDYVMGFESYRKMFVLFSALPFASNFADEWNSKTTASCVTRKSAEGYAVSNIVMCFISAFLAVFAGMMIYVLILSTYMPLYDTVNPLGSPYEPLFRNGAPMLGLMLTVFVYAMSCGMWAVMGMTASAFFPSKYIAICAPFVFSYVIDRFSKVLSEKFQFSQEFRLETMSKSWSGWGALPSFLKANLIFLAISAICGIIFMVRVKRRVENELS